MTILRRCLLALLLIVAVPAVAAGDAGWFYRGSDIAPDPAWRFGTLPNGLKYAVRRNALPAGQVSIRVRIDAGSLNEQDAERGFAHYVEHLAFRGTKTFQDREARQIWQQLGASFGSDSNAFTTATQTVYQLDLPKNDKASLDTSLDVIAEMMDSARFEPAAVDGERKIVLAEKGRRPELTNRMVEASWPLFYAGLRYAERDPIGTPETLAAARPESLRAFYERWYRPERATVIMVGDADPAVMEALIAEHFGAWLGEGPPPADPDYGRIATPAERAAAVVYPGAPHASTLIWLRPYVEEPDTRSREQADLATSLAARILNRRLEARARGGEAPFLTSVIGQDRATDVADVTQLSITAREGRWREALAETFSIIADGRRAPPSEAEISRELSNLRTAALAGVEAETTLRSNQRAQQMVTAIDGNSVLASAQTILTLIDSFRPAMTPAYVWEAMKGLFEGSGPRLMQLAPDPIDVPAVNAALAAAEKAAPATRLADRAVSFDTLPALGKPGEEVSRQRIEDLGVTIVRFANGATLTFKQTDFEKGNVLVQTRFGRGRLGMDRDKPSPDWLAGIIGPSGMADLDLDAMERLLTGRRIAMAFGVDDDAYVLRGQTNGQEIGDQLRLMATKLAYPRWDEGLFARFKSGSLEAYDLSWASATARAGRELPGFLRPNDERWRPVEREELASATLDSARRYFDPRLADGPLEVIVVGDVDLETVVAAMKRTIAALPARAETPVPAAALAVRPPQPDPKPKTFTHRGDPNQAFAAIGWTTIGGTAGLQDRRALSVAANLLQVRLFDELREVEGATYSPSAASSGSDEFQNWGVFYASAEIRPESADTFFRIARRIVAELAAKPVAAEEFERAQNPIVSGIERRVKTNAYWLDVMEGWLRHPELIDATRSYQADYAKMTAEDVRRAVATHVTDAGDWSLLVVPGKADGGGT